MRQEWKAERCDTRTIVLAVDDTGNKFFNPSSMRFFGSRVGSSGWRIVNSDGGTFGFVVVTSELDFYKTDRRYSVRLFTFTDGGRRSSHSEDGAGFRGYGSRAEAVRASGRFVRRLVDGLGLMTEVTGDNR